MDVRQLLRPLLQCAITNHNLFTDNATMKQGLPRLPHVTIDDSLPAGTTPAAAQALPIAQALPAAGSKLLPLALAAATALGTGGMGAGIAAWLLSGSRSPAVAPVSPVAVESEAGLLSDLQERGYHLSRGDE
jgi:hypothetical protein